jgi:hypothetical protein
VSNPPLPPRPTATPAGWFPDPLARHEHRYFNGVSWTSDVSDGGQRMVDPLGTGPGYAYGVKQSNGMATAALTCGTVGILIAWMPFVVLMGIGLGVLALVFGIKGLKRSSTAGSGRGMAIAGIVTGGLTLLTAIIGVVLSVVLFRAIADFIEPGPVDTDIADCRLDGRNATIEGTLTNESRSERDYTLFVTLDEQVDIITVDDLGTGETVEWVAQVRTRSQLDTCRPTLIVQGPFPFGIKIDPIES